MPHGHQYYMECQSVSKKMHRWKNYRSSVGVGCVDVVEGHARKACDNAANTCASLKVPL